MTINERLQEAFDKRVGGTAMLPASELLSAMSAIEQLEETIAQQAEAIRLKDEALIAVRDDLELRMRIAEDDSLNISNSVLDQMCDAIDIQPSPEILQARDDLVAEACASLVNRFISGDGILNETWIHEIEETIAQQAEAIEKLRDHIELSLEFCDEEGFCVRDNLENALAIQPSPEILQIRDERVAEACAKVVDPRSLAYVTRGDALAAILSGEWRKYL